jgi:hypothetical protein
VAKTALASGAIDGASGISSTLLRIFLDSLS